MEEGETYSKFQVVNQQDDLKSVMEGATVPTVFVLPDDTYPVNDTIRPIYSFGMLGTSDTTTLKVSGVTADMDTIISANLTDEQRSLRIKDIHFTSAGEGSTIQLNSMVEGGTTEYLNIAAIQDSDFSHDVKGNPLAEYVSFEDVRNKVSVNDTAFDLTRVEGSAVKAVCKGITEGTTLSDQSGF